MDFENRRIRVDHQLVRERGGKYYVEKTKTECGCRYVPMTEEVYQSLQNILVRCKKVKTEIVVDGYGSFLLLDKDDKPKVALHIENEMRWAMKKYKNLQYVMGHSDVGVTLNVYIHASFERETEQMARIIDFKDTDMQGNKRKSS